MTGNLEQLTSMIDSHCKILLGNSQVISRFVQCFVEEANNLSLEEIESCICATEISEQNIDNIPIHGNNTYVFSDDKSYVNFDILIKLDFPQSKGEDIRVFLNLEAQNNTSPGYALITRGIVYCAMMISRQYNIEFNSKTYSDLKKVYSIWVMPQASKKKDGLIRNYKINESILKGDMNQKNKKEKYDKMEVIEIYTSDFSDQEFSNQDKLENLMSSVKILLSKSFSKDKKIKH